MSLNSIKYYAWFEGDEILYDQVWSIEESDDNHSYVAQKYFEHAYNSTNERKWISSDTNKPVVCVKKDGDSKMHRFNIHIDFIPSFTAYHAIEYGHYWSYCDLCDHEVVICGKCGNNTCNGGYGEVDGEECGSCPSAYDLYLNTSPEDRPKQTKEKPEQCSRCGVWMNPNDMCIAEEFCEHYSWVIDE